MDTNIKIGVVYADAHSPNEDKPSCRIVREVIKDLKPQRILNLGDGADFDSISHFLKNSPLKKEGLRLHDEIVKMYELDDYLTEFAPKGCKKVRHIGNHEYRLIRYIDEHAELAGLPDLDIIAHYRADNWDVCRWGNFYKLGKLYFHHGDRKGYQTMYHSKSWALSGKSICYAHRHDAQRFTTETIGSDGRLIPNTAISIGCLGVRTPKWMDNQRNNWSNGFGVFYMRPGGYFNFYHVDIIKGKAVWNGKLYDGTRR